MIEIIKAYGHENIRGTHETTVEITKDRKITSRADCIVGVGADRALADFSDAFRKKAKNSNAIIKVTLTVGRFKETIIGRGHPDLTFTHSTDIVIRKSNFISSRTLMINADKSSEELNRGMIELLKDRKQKVVMEVEVTVPP
ncbi:MAG: DUF371 domain-containing protein [Candidatus Hydrothermarchaeaceae archaeon]